ncbi:MAG: hypothetical protein WC428_07670 [Candidatus Paceibacterota bacterium]|jgi:hypothetical protein
MKVRFIESVFGAINVGRGQVVNLTPKEANYYIEKKMAVAVFEAGDEKQLPPEVQEIKTTKTKKRPIRRE